MAPAHRPKYTSLAVQEENPLTINIQPVTQLLQTQLKYISTDHLIEWGVNSSILKIPDMMVYFYK